jgi:membrane protein
MRGDDRPRLWISAFFSLLKPVWGPPWRVINAVFNRGPIGAYRSINGGDLAATIAFNALLALVPMILLMIALAGQLIKDPDRLNSAIEIVGRALPAGQSREAVDTLLTARNQSARLGLASLIGLLWIGTSFVTTLARAMDRIYRAPERHFVQNRIRAFVIVLLFTFLLLASALSAALPTYFLNNSIPKEIEKWTPPGTLSHIVGYAISIVAGILLFGIVHYFLPNAGQGIRDIWPGVLAATISFTLLTQGFPIYLQLTQNANRYGALFGVVWLLLTWFLLLAHILVISTIINAWNQRRRRSRTTAAPIG